MTKGRSTISKVKSYKEIGDFWDQTKKVEFGVDVKSEIIYCSLDKKLAEKVQSIAQRRGVSPDTLINLWVQEKLQEQTI